MLVRPEFQFQISRHWDQVRPKNLMPAYKNLDQIQSLNLELRYLRTIHTSVRQVFRLLGMCKTYGAKSVNAACQKALDLDVVDVQRIDKMLAKGLEKLLIDTPRPRLALVTPLRFARSPQEFALDRPAPPKPGEPDVSS